MSMDAGAVMYFDWTSIFIGFVLGLALATNVYIVMLILKNKGGDDEHGNG